MPRAALSIASCLVTALILLTLAAGCEQYSEGKGGQAAAIVTHVDVVHPERHTVRRTVGEPGELQAFETAAIHTRVPGYVKAWTVNIGARVKKGQVLAELSVPELEASFHQKKAAVAQAVAHHRLIGAAVKLADANIAGAQARLAEERAGIKRVDADVPRWEAEFHRIEQLFRDRAQTGSLLDETRYKLRASEATRDEVRAQVTTAEVAVTQARAARDLAEVELGTAAAAIDVATEDARHSEALLGYATIQAPFDGIVTQRNVNTGDLTEPGPDRPPLFTVAKADVLTICVAVPSVRPRGQPRRSRDRRASGRQGPAHRVEGHPHLLGS